MNVHTKFDLNFVAIPVPEIIGFTLPLKKSGSPGYAHAPFSPKFLIGLWCFVTSIPLLPIYDHCRAHKCNVSTTRSVVVCSRLAYTHITHVILKHKRENRKQCSV